MKSTFLIAIVLLLSASVAMAQPLPVEEQIKNFYVQYMKAIENGHHEQVDQLIDKFLTAEMQDKKGRLTVTTDADPILRAQDVSAYGMQSVECRHLEDEWYEVSYRWKDDNDACIYIPLMVKSEKKGEVKIAYVTPVWSDRKYGDYLFDVPSVKVQDGKDAAIFVETFFRAYTYPYVKMSPTLKEYLARLCTTYFRLQCKRSSLRLCNNTGMTSVMTTL